MTCRNSFEASTSVKGDVLQIISLYTTQNSYGVAEKTAKL